MHYNEITGEGEEMTENFVRLTANAGVLLCINGKKILVDALHNRYTEVFSSVPDDLLYEAAHGEGEFREIDLALFTHDHPDHYSREWTWEFLKNHPDTHIISPIDDFSGKNITVLKAPEETHETKGIKLECVRLTHEGEQFRDVVNYGYRFDVDGFIITILGDSGPEDIPQVFGGADLALYNFPFFTILRGKKMIEELRPKKMIAYHLPYEEKDVNGYIQATLRSIERNGYKNASALWKRDQKAAISL